MRKRYGLIAGIVLFLSGAVLAENGLIVKKTSGGSESFAFPKISKIVFTENAMELHEAATGTVRTFNFVDIGKLYFGDADAGVTTVAESGNLEFYASGGTIGVKGLPEAKDAYVVDMGGRVCMALKQWDGSPVSVSALSGGVYILVVGNNAFKFVK